MAQVATALGTLDLVHSAPQSAHSFLEYKKEDSKRKDGNRKARSHPSHFSFTAPGPSKSNPIAGSGRPDRTPSGMASLTLPPAPPNPRQDAIDLHKAFKGPCLSPPTPLLKIALLDKDRFGRRLGPARPREAALNHGFPTISVWLQQFV